MNLNALDPCGFGFEMPQNFVKDVSKMALPGVPDFDGKSGWSETDCARLKAGAVASGLLTANGTPIPKPGPAPLPAPSDIVSTIPGSTGPISPVINPPVNNMLNVEPVSNEIFGINKTLFYGGLSLLAFLFFAKGKK